MKVNINTKEVPNLISIPFLCLVGFGIIVMVAGLINALCL